MTIANNSKFKILLVTVIASAFFASCSVCKIDNNLQVESSKITEMSKYQATIYTDIVINAPANKVWATLTNFSKMPNWSSTLKGLSGDIKNGGNVIVKFDLGNGQVVDIPRSPLLYSEGKFFGWSGEITSLKGMTDNHKYKIEAISKCQSRFIQTEEFKGENPNITLIALANMSLEQYKIFNKELKKEVEKN